MAERNGCGLTPGLLLRPFDLAEKRRMALVLVTHDESLAARCGRRLRLVQGKLAD